MAISDPALTEPEHPTRVLVLVVPNFNMAATMAFVDPLRAANYIAGQTQFRWVFAGLAAQCPASNGAILVVKPLADIANDEFDLVVVSSSWSPETANSAALRAALRRWHRLGWQLAGLDTGAFILADAGLLKGHRATVHYEHIDAFKELHGDIDVVEDMIVEDQKFITCSGGFAASDMGLHIVARQLGPAVASHAARFVFHPGLRAAGTSQNALPAGPIAQSVPAKLHEAINLMEKHLEHVLTLPELGQRMGISQRHLARLFQRHVGLSPVSYYRNIRLDRARGLITQTDLAVAEVALASGFSNPVNFSRAYRLRFGLSPSRDRVEGRIPFDYRAWPMHGGIGQKS
jgi:transcriptional regulator GlxA family with amidase domain